MFSNNYHEPIPLHFARLFEDTGKLKSKLWEAFNNTGLMGICEDDCSVIPRILPGSYLPVIKDTCKDLMLFLMRLISLPPKELMAILPPSPVADYLIREFGLLKHRPRRLTGSLRFDMAIVGKASASNPPKLFEINEIGFDGTGRSSLIQEILLDIIPGLRERVFCLDTAASEVRNMLRLGKNFARFQYDSYNWEEEVIVRKAKEIGLKLRLVSPSVFGTDIENGCEMLARERVHFKDKRVYVGADAGPCDAFQMSYSFELGDYKEAPVFFRNLIRARTAQYSPFYTSLIAPKTILVVLSDNALVRRIVGAPRARRLKDTILPARLLNGCLADVKHNAKKLVIKYADGMGGEMDYIGSEMKPMLKRISAKERKYWVAQKRVHMNTMTVHGILSRPRRVIADLGVYIHYDWDGERFTNLSIGGLITRATNKSLKVNVSGGGIQVPVMFDRATLFAISDSQ